MSSANRASQHGAKLRMDLKTLNREKNVGRVRRRGEGGREGGREGERERQREERERGWY